MIIRNIGLQDGISIAYYIAIKKYRVENALGWNLLKHLQRNEHRVEVDLPLNDLPAPGNPIDNADSGENLKLSFFV